MRTEAGKRSTGYSSSWLICFLCLALEPKDLSLTMRTGLGAPTRSRAMAFTAFVLLYLRGRFT